MFNEDFHVPPTIPFGSAPPAEWCYYFEKASYARQTGDWDEVLHLGEDAISRGFFAKDQIEWIPFLQAYAYAGNTTRLNEIASFMISDPLVFQQACQTLKEMQLDPSTVEKASQLFCAK